MTIAITEQTTHAAWTAPRWRAGCAASGARGRCRALLLVAPLMLFLLAIFVLPIGVLLTRSVDNSEVARTLPRDSRRTRTHGMAKARPTRRSTPPSPPT